MLLFLLGGFDKLRGLTGWVLLNKVYEGPVVKDRGRDSSEAGIPSFFYFVLRNFEERVRDFWVALHSFRGVRATSEADRTTSDGDCATLELDRTALDGDCATLEVDRTALDGDCATSTCHCATFRHHCTTPAPPTFYNFIHLLCSF